MVAILALAVIPWTKWPFDVAFRFERNEVAKSLTNDTPFDGSLRIGHYITRTHFETEAGLLFPGKTTTRHVAGYLRCPAGPPPEPTTALVGDASGGTIRRSIHFTEIHPLPEGWYATVWEWGETQPTALGR